MKNTTNVIVQLAEVLSQRIYKKGYVTSDEIEELYDANFPFDFHRLPMKDVKTGRLTYGSYFSGRVSAEQAKSVAHDAAENRKEEIKLLTGYLIKELGVVSGEVSTPEIEKMKKGLLERYKILREGTDPSNPNYEHWRHNWTIVIYSDTQENLERAISIESEDLKKRLEAVDEVLKQNKKDLGKKHESN